MYGSESNTDDSVLLWMHLYSTTSATKVTCIKVFFYTQFTQFGGIAAYSMLQN